MPKQKKTLRQASSVSTTETSKPCLRIRFSDPLLKHLRTLDRESRQVLGQAINDARDAWGQPRLHAGTGIRKLSPFYFECRSGLGLRLLFEDFGADGLYFVFMGNHDDVRRFLKSNR